ncbi:hypothetical protein [Rhodococcus kronopolitis]|uniref:Secreted protein n=1 Tax=Rhodococcus kronopolitis TaxID=1460226 RepID=A0ABV9FRH0_9NOCA
MINARRTAAAIAFVALPILGVFGAAAANAEPIGPNGPTGSCPVVNTDDQGNETVINHKPGDVSHGLVCGADGEWHLPAKAGSNTGPGRVETQPELSQDESTSGPTKIQSRPGLARA